MKSRVVGVLNTSKFTVVFKTTRHMSVTFLVTMVKPLAKAVYGKALLWFTVYGGRTGRQLAISHSQTFHIKSSAK